jgi:CRISPR/Cas system-associated endonuclease Cas1
MEGGFKDRAKAERWAERQQRLAFVKKVTIARLRNSLRSEDRANLGSNNPVQTQSERLPKVQNTFIETERRSCTSEDVGDTARQFSAIYFS